MRTFLLRIYRKKWKASKERVLDEILQAKQLS